MASDGVFCTSMLATMQCVLHLTVLLMPYCRAMSLDRRPDILAAVPDVAVVSHANNLRFRDVKDNEISQCGPNEMYLNCGAVCQDTCDTLEVPVECSEDYCVAGCFCKPGYVRTSVYGHCIRVSECSKCLLQPDAGPCNPLLLRFYYDGFSRTCQPFVYGGCGGNANNFNSFSDCMDACARKGTCSDGSRPLKCAYQPCSMTQCPSFPQAKCDNDYCGACKARFFLPDGLEVTSRCEEHSCATMLCPKDYRCVDGASGSQCVPTCTQSSCAKDDRCVDTSVGFSCVPKAL